MPATVNLRKHGMSHVSGCKVCGCYRETTGHALLFCTHAKGIWRKTRFGALFKNCPIMSGGTMLSHAMSTLPDDDFVEWLSLCYSLWLDRNRVTHEGQQSDPEQLVANCVAWVAEFRLAHVHIEPPMSRRGHHEDELKWKALRTGTLKLNVDASIMEHCVGWGVIVRDCFGSMICGSCVYKEGTFGVDVAEGLAIRGGLELCRDRHVQVVTAETDSQMVASNLMNHSSAHPPATIYEDISRLKELCGTVEVRWICRSTNVVAHTAAHYAARDKASLSWLENCPSFLIDCVRKDKVAL